jgi:hypothetical protein
MTNSLSCTVVAQISLLRATTRVIERHTLDGTLAVLDFGTTVVTHHYGLSRHDNPPSKVSFSEKA